MSKMGIPPRSKLNNLYKRRWHPNQVKRTQYTNELQRNFTLTDIRFLPKHHACYTGVVYALATMGLAWQKGRHEG